MMTHQAHPRRRFAGRWTTASTAGRAWPVVLAALSLIALTYGVTPTPVTAQTSTPAPGTEPAPTADPAQNGPDIEHIKDWSLQCTKPQADKPRACFLIHDVFPTTGNVRILQVVVGRFGDDQLLGALFFVPLGIRLPPGLTVQIDKNEPLRLQIERCTSKGCQAQVALAEPFLSSLKAGNAGEVTFEDAGGRQVAVPISLQGFTAGLKKLP